MCKFSFLLILLLTPVAYAQNSVSYDVDHFRANFHSYKIGDTAPDILFSEGYNITKWKIRHLPTPSQGKFWSYMDGTYVLIGYSDHKIARAMSSDIFYLKMKE
jgi:Ni/Co efflux regulator RcnB